MRIAVLSDIHGNLPALEAVLADLAPRGVDIVVNLGDSLSGPLWPAETAEFLMAQYWVHLAGNHERHLLTHGPGERGLSDEYAWVRLSPTTLSWIASLPTTARVGDDVLLCHGTPRDDAEYFLDTVEAGRVRPATASEVEERLGDPAPPLVLCGHTHLPRAVRTRRGTLIVNPGSVGLPAYDDDTPMPHVIETGSPDARYAIVERRGTAWSAALHLVAYDHASAAALARENGRPEWEQALLTGYLQVP